MSKQLRRPTGVMYGDHIWPVVTGYDLVSTYYDEWYWQSFWITNESPLILQEIKKLNTDLSPALDVGTGTGFYIKELLRLGIECVGVDASKAMLSEAKNKLPSSVNLICGNIEKLPFKDKTFNLITSCRVFSHVSKLNLVMQELGRITKIGGYLIVSDVSASHNYTTTRIPRPDGDVHIETYKNTVNDLVKSAEYSEFWKLGHIKSVTYKDLLWKPQQTEYPAIDFSSVKPIFFYGLFIRNENER